jgi:hypothetical protein
VTSGQLGSETSHGTSSNTDRTKGHHLPTAAAVQRNRLLVLAQGGRCDGSGEVRPAKHIGAVHELTDRTNQGQVTKPPGVDLAADGRHESVGEDHGVAAVPERTCSCVDVLGNAELVVPRGDGFISGRKVTLAFIRLVGAYRPGEDRRKGLGAVEAVECCPEPLRIRRVPALHE